MKHSIAKANSAICGIDVSIVKCDERKKDLEYNKKLQLEVIVKHEQEILELKK